jgi:hypothetical protein
LLERAHDESEAFVHRRPAGLQREGDFGQIGRRRLPDEAQKITCFLA